jgi:opacity protein-like surface antigen
MRVITCVLLAMLVVSSVAWSQSGLGIDCYLGGGISVLSGPKILKDENRMGFNASGGIFYDISPTVSLIVGVDYVAFPKDETQARQEVLRQMPVTDRVGSGISIGDGGTFSIFTVTGNVKLLLGSRDDEIAPYVVVGAGFLSTSVPDVQASYMHSDQTFIPVPTYFPVVLQRTQFNVSSAFTASVGAGIDMPFGEANTLFLEGRYAVGFAAFDNTTYFPVRLGVRFGL